MMKAIMIAALTLLVSSSAMATTYSFSGTSGNDIIIIGRLQALISGTWVTVGPRKRVNGILSSFSSSPVSGDIISVSSLAGNDYIEMVGLFFGNHTISSTQRLVPLVGVRLEAFAGDGDDQVIGGDSGDNIYGEYGADDLYGSNGQDMIIGNYYGGPDSENFLCGSTLLEPDAYDSCDGGAGNSDFVICNGFTAGGPGINDICGGAPTSSTSCETIYCD